MEFEFWWLLVFPLFFALGWLAARVDIRQVVTESRALPNSYFRGVNFLLNEQPDKAIEEFNAAIKIDADLYDAIYNLGMAYAQAGRKEDAKSWLTRATKGAGKLGPDQIKAANDMLMHLARPGQ